MNIGSQYCDHPRQPCKYIHPNYPVNISACSYIVHYLSQIYENEAKFLSVLDMLQIFYRTDMYICHICQFGKGKYFLSFIVNNIIGID